MLAMSRQYGLQLRLFLLLRLLTLQNLPPGLVRMTWVHIEPQTRGLVLQGSPRSTTCHHTGMQLVPFTNSPRLQDLACEASESEASKMRVQHSR